MKNFRKLSALILSALASFTLLVGCGAAPVEDTTPTESAPVVPVVEKTAPETTPEATPEETSAPQSDTTEKDREPAGIPLYHRPWRRQRRFSLR